MSAEPMLELHWSAPAECPDRERVVARVEELVGRMPEGKHTLVATGAVTKAPRYTLSLTIGDAPARVMSGDDCDKLADAAALVIALDIDPDALSRPPPEPPPPPP